jgi:hypothetical protein
MIGVSGLPPRIQALFWEYQDGGVSLPGDVEFIIERVLSAGDWDAIQWLRGEMGSAPIRRYLQRTRGRRLSPRQLRLWQVLLDLPSDEVDTWLQDQARRDWDARTA